jgi:hypothetical protein
VDVSLCWLDNSGEFGAPGFLFLLIHCFLGFQIFLQGEPSSRRDEEGSSSGDPSDSSEDTRDRKSRSKRGKDKKSKKKRKKERKEKARKKPKHEKDEKPKQKVRAEALAKQ